MAKLVRLEKLNVVKYSSNPVKIEMLKEDGFKIVENVDIPIGLAGVNRTEEDKDIIENKEVGENTEVNAGESIYKFDEMKVDEIKAILDEKGIEYNKTAKKEVLFALLV